jgi:DNA-binding SARP family transcriptional activator
MVTGLEPDGGRLHLVAQPKRSCAATMAAQELSPVGDLHRRRSQPPLRPEGGGQVDLDLTLLGGFRLCVDGLPVGLPVGAQRLVALLALRGRMSRSRLAGMLWPDTTEPRALASLRTAIWRVNQLAPGLVLSAGDTVDVALHTRIDVREFVERATSVLRDAESGPDRWPAVMQEGDLLVDWSDSWLTNDRERLHQLRLHLLERLSERLTADGRFGLAVEAVLAALRRDGLRESAHRALIRAHLAEGNIGEARRAYATCVQVLGQELGVAPSPATTMLLRQGELPSNQRGPGTPRGWAAPGSRRAASPHTSTGLIRRPSPSPPPAGSPARAGPAARRSAASTPDCPARRRRS